MKLECYQLTNPTLARLLSHCRRLRGLQAIVDDLNLPGKVTVLNLRNNQLILGVTQPAQATRLRFAAEQIRDDINHELKHLRQPIDITAVSIRLLPPTERKQPRAMIKPLPISERAARSIQAAGSVTTDPRLKKVLARLAKSIDQNLDQ